MQIVKLFFGVIIGFSLLSCSQAEEGDLEVSMTGSSAYLISASAQSCKNKVAVFISPSTATPTSDISADYFSFEGATINWKNTKDTAYIIQMKIEFKDSNLTHSCTISGDELASIFFDYTTGASGTAWDGTLAPAASAATPTTISSQCKIRCGGLSVASGKKSFTSMGTLTLSGFQLSPPPSNEEKPIKTTTSIKLIYQ